MTVQEFYDFCKERKMTDAEMQISLKYAGRDLNNVKVNEWNIDYGIKKCFPHIEGKKWVKLGG